jgi:uncharacterized coiled-coil DUF342 family protein
LSSKGLGIVSIPDLLYSELCDARKREDELEEELVKAKQKIRRLKQRLRDVQQGLLKRERSKDG